MAWAYVCVESNCRHLLSQHRFPPGEQRAKCRHCDCTVAPDARGVSISQREAERDHRPELDALAAETAARAARRA